jgi:hypothetical protein
MAMEVYGLAAGFFEDKEGNLYANSNQTKIFGRGFFRKTTGKVNLSKAVDLNVNSSWMSTTMTKENMGFQAISKRQLLAMKIIKI